MAIKALVCLLKLSIDVTDRCCNSIVTYRETESSKGSLFPQWAALQPRICDRLICADDILEEYLTLISLSAKGLYQMTTQEEKGPD